MTTGLYATTAVLVLMLQGNLSAFSSQVTAQASPPSAESPTDLVEVPQPDLARVDPVVQEHIRAAQTTLATALASPHTPAAEKGEAFGGLGQIYQAYGFVDAALACYQNAAKLQPQSFKWHYYSGFLEQRRGETESALRAYRQAQALQPNDRCVLLRLGYLELDASHLDSAESWFVKSMAQPNPPAAAMAGLGKVALAAHEYPAALKYFKQALTREPQASSLHYQLAMTYRALGDTTRMKEQLQARGATEPTIKDPLLDEIDLLKQGKVGLLERATRAMHERHFADAAASYRQMIRLDPNDAIAYRYLGVALAMSGNRKQALLEYEHSLQLDPNNAPAHYSIGILLIEAGKDEAAIPHFRDAIRLDPGRIATHFQLANLLMRQGKDDEAGREYAAVVALDPQNRFACLMQAMAAIHAGAYAQGRSLLEEAALAFPADPDIGNALARLLAAAPDPAVRDENRALRIIESLVQKQQGDPFEAGVTLAMVLAAVGRFKEAASYQAAIIHELESSRQFALANQLRQNLDLYEHGKRCTTPWAQNDPVFSPVPGKVGLPSVD